MNAPENINSLRQEIAQHLASTGEATAKQIAEAILQEKVEVARALNDMHKSAEVEREKKRGNEYVYWLSAAAAAPKKTDAGIPASEGTPTKTYPPETLRAMVEEHEAEKDGEPSFLAPEDYEMPPADPALLAMANRALSEQLDDYRGQLAHIATTAADYLPDPSDITTARAVEIMDTLIEAQRGQIDALSAKLLAKDNELFIQAKVVVDLRDRLDALTQQWEADTGRITAYLRAALESRSQVINEADRLRRELTDAQEVTDAAVGYLVRVTKRKPRYVTQPERARDAALAAVRAGAGRAEVLAVVPVGVARRGAEWRGINDLTSGD